MNLFRLRLPKSMGGCRLEGKSERLIYSVTDEFADCSNGFFFAPFGLNPEISFIPFDDFVRDEQEFDTITAANDLTAASGNPLSAYSTTREEHMAYVEQLVRLIKRIENDIHTPAKIIAARALTLNATLSPSGIFRRLDEKYPEACIFLFSTPETGTWAGATPELLLDDDSVRFATMSLAGTRPAGTLHPWDSKNMEEQGIVTEFIVNVLKDRNIIGIKTDGPHTVNAGPVEHLATKISAVRTGDYFRLLRLLSPTPALSGFPRDTAIDTITDMERFNRDYYGGLIGINLTGNDIHNNAKDEELRPYSYHGSKGNSRRIAFVNLRSCRTDIPGGRIRLFAGGGITRNSVPAEEWEETERKLSTICPLLTEPPE